MPCRMKKEACVCAHVYRYKWLSSAEPAHTATALLSQRGGNTASTYQRWQNVPVKLLFFDIGNEGIAEGPYS